MCLKLSISRKATANLTGYPPLTDKTVCVLLDDPPGRQTRQLVIVCTTKKLLLGGLLLADIDRARKYKLSVRNQDRLMRGEIGLCRMIRPNELFGYPGPARLQ